MQDDHTPENHPGDELTSAAPEGEAEHQTTTDATKATLLDEHADSTSTLTLLESPRSLPASAGIEWVKEAWELFKEQPGIWIGIVVAFIVLITALSFIPIVNMLLVVLSSIFIGGVVAVAYQQDNGKIPEVAQLLSHFQKNIGQQLLVGVLYMVGYFIAMIPTIVVAIIAGGGLAWILSSTGGEPDGAAIGAVAGMGLLMFVGTFVAIIFASIVMVIVSMALWFAPALVAIHGMDAIASMKLSFKACMKNILPFLMYLFVQLGLSMLCAMTLGLGFIVVGPILAIVFYTSYKDVFLQKEESPTV